MAARLADGRQVIVAQISKSSVTKASVHGPDPLSGIQCRSILSRKKFKIRPTRMPPPTALRVVLRTIHTMCDRCAPSAIRMPSSLVRCAITKESVLAKPTKESARARTAKNEKRMEKTRCRAQTGWCRRLSSRSSTTTITLCSEFTAWNAVRIALSDVRGRPVVRMISCV